MTGWLMVFLGGYAAYDTYCYHAGNSCANRSVDLLTEGKLEEAIEEANKAIRLYPKHVLSYFVRGAARFHLIKQKQSEESYQVCKPDLEKAQAESPNEEVRTRAGRFLSMIKAIEDEQSSF